MQLVTVTRYAASGWDDRRGAQNDNAMKEPSPKSVFRFALIFGIVAATVEMALLLWFMYG